MQCGLYYQLRIDERMNCPSHLLAEIYKPPVLIRFGRIQHHYRQYVSTSIQSA